MAIYAAEARLYWCAASAAREAKRQGLCPLVRGHLEDEIEVIALHTDWARLRSVCRKTLTSLRPERRFPCVSLE